MEIEESTRQRLRDFYAVKFPYCFELAFKEALKNDDRGFKAFQIWMLEETRAQHIKLAAGQERIEAAINGLKNGVSYLSQEQADKILEAQAHTLYRLLEEDFVDIENRLQELSKYIKEHFEKHYQLSEAIYGVVTATQQEVAATHEDVKKIDATTTQTLGVVTATSENIYNIKEELTRIKGEKGIPHHLVNPLPPLPELFLGRDAELEAIRFKLFEEANFLLLVNGQGGIGKTSLAATYYHRYSHYYTHAA